MRTVVALRGAAGRQAQSAMNTPHIPPCPFASSSGFLEGLVRRFVMSTAMLLAACTVLAQSANVTPAVLTEAATSQELDGLILSPSDRRRLHSARLAMQDPEQRSRSSSLDNPSLEDAAKALPDTLSVRGTVIRTGDRSTVWINGQPVYGRAAPTALRDLATVSGVLQSGVKDVKLKARPGQVIELPSGQAVDLLPRGAITINRPKAAAASRNEE